MRSEQRFISYQEPSHLSFEYSHVKSSHNPCAGSARNIGDMGGTGQDCVQDICRGETQRDSGSKEIIL